MLNKSTQHLAHMLTAVCLLAGLMTGALAQSLDGEVLKAQISGSDRDISDRMRDSARQPVEVLQFLGLEPGMTVLDVYAAGGYYTYILSKAVGPAGIVYAQNSPRALRYDEDRTDISQGDALANKIRDGQLQNVERIDRGIQDSGLPEASVDFVLVSQILHDYFNRSPASAYSLLVELHRLLRPGGIIGIIDHHGAPGNDNRRLHRMVQSDAEQVITDAGFIIEAESELLLTDGDNPRRSIFDPMLNRGTSQFLLRARKPADSL